MADSKADSSADLDENHENGNDFSASLVEDDPVDEDGSSTANADSEAAEDPELEAIKARVREMEEEAEKLKQMQDEVEKQMSLSPPSKCLNLQSKQNVYVYNFILMTTCN